MLHVIYCQGSNHCYTLHLMSLDDNVMLFQVKKHLGVSIHDAWWFRISITTQYGNIYVIILQLIPAHRTEVLELPAFLHESLHRIRPT